MTREEAIKIIEDYLRDGTPPPSPYSLAKVCQFCLDWLKKGVEVDATVDVNSFLQGYFFPDDDVPNMHYGDKVKLIVKKK